jgi:hypothetical protein
VWRKYYQFASLAMMRTVDAAHVFRMRYEGLAGDPASTLRAEGRLNRQLEYD